MGKISVKNLDLYYGDFKALKNINLEIEANKITAFIGPSGCGKSTLLKSINRMNDLVEECCIDGDILLDGQNIFKGMDVNLLRKRVGMVFQKPNPFPMSIYDNIAYGPRTHGIRSKAKLDDIVEKSLRNAAIWDECKDRLKKSALGMSGGQQQRVALARILACEPELLLLDEPFSALDSYLKEELQFELKQHLREFGKTTIIVSHDRDGIYKLCDRTMVMGQGEILVSKDTKELFEQPERVIAARLTGCKNISRAKKCGMHKVYAMDWGVELTVDRKVSEKITHVGIRAHDFHPADASSHDSENKIPVAVDREVRAPFEWTILFETEKIRKKICGWKMEREQTQIPQWVQVDPKRILLLEE